MAEESLFHCACIGNMTVMYINRTKIIRITQFHLIITLREVPSEYLIITTPFAFFVI